LLRKNILFSLEEIRNYIVKFILNYKDKKYLSDNIFLKSSKLQLTNNKDLSPDKLFPEGIIKSEKVLLRKLSSKNSSLNLRRKFHTTSNTYKSSEDSEYLSWGGKKPKEYKANNLDYIMNYLDKSVQEEFFILLLSIKRQRRRQNNGNFFNIFNHNLTDYSIKFTIRPNKIVSNINKKYFEYFDFKTILSPYGIEKRNKDFDIRKFSFYSIYLRSNKVFTFLMPCEGGKVNINFNEDKLSSPLNKKIIPYVRKFVVLFLDPNCILLRSILKVYDKLIVPLLPYINPYILGKISHLKFIYSTLNNSSLVKLFLNIVLEDTILIASPINESNNSKKNQLLYKASASRKINLIKNKELYNLYRIHRNDSNNLISDNGISISRVKINEILTNLYMKELKGLNNQYTNNRSRKYNLKSKRIVAIYLITRLALAENVNNNYSKVITNFERSFYYIGSSINLDSRLKNHINR
jgi:hypothetical protein